MKLPQLSGVELIKKLQKHGFVVVRQKGVARRGGEAEHRRVPEVAENSLLP
jgi:predicted RNA binding protein YcfA (HicA-like mRNA interferase family)